MKKVVIDENVYNRFRRTATYNDLFRNFIVRLEDEDVNYLDDIPDYLCDIISSDICIKHAAYMRSYSCYSTSLTVRDLGDDTFRLEITSKLPNIWGNMNEILARHEDVGTIIDKNDAIELVTYMLGDGLSNNQHC